MKKLMVLLVAFMTICTIANGTAMAAPYASGAFQIGDVFAAVSSGTVQVWRGTTNLGDLNTGLGGFTTGMATDSSGNLYVTNFSASSVSKFSNTGALLGTFGSGYSTPEDILFNAAGEAYVGNLWGGGIRKFGSTGTFLASYYGSGRVDWFDLKSDQNTMLITDEGLNIYTLDLSTNITGTFATGLTNGFALRILSDGSVLVADMTNIKKFSSIGVLSNTYDVAGEDNWFSLNLDPNGTSFWSGDFGTANFYEFNLATGTQIGAAYNTRTGSQTLYGLAVYGEKTESGGGVTGRVPEPGTMVLLGSGLVGLVGFGRKRFLK